MIPTLRATLPSDKPLVTVKLPASAGVPDTLLPRKAPCTYTPPISRGNATTPRPGEQESWAMVAVQSKGSTTGCKAVGKNQH